MESSTWNLSSAAAAAGASGRRLSTAAEEDDDEEYQKHRKLRVSRRKPLPPIDLQGISHSFSLPRSSSNNTHQHSSFSTVKPRHQFVKSPFVPEDKSVAQQQRPSLPTPSSPQQPPAAWTTHQQQQRTFTTYNCCYCFQIQVEKNRSCTSTLLWLCFLLLLISAFSVLTFFLSHYYFGLFSLSRHDMHFLNRFYGGMGLQDDGNAAMQTATEKPWMDQQWSELPESEDLYLHAPPVVLPQALEPARAFLLTATQFSLEQGLGNVRTVVFPHGVDLVNALAMFPHAQSIVMFGSAPVPKLEETVECELECLERASKTAAQAALDLNTEGFVLPTTLAACAEQPLGALPVLLTSVQVLQGQVAHMAEMEFAHMRCLKMYITRKNEEMLTATYCGGLDEKSEQQRSFLRNLLKSQPTPLGLIMRGSGYAFFPNVKPHDTTMFNLHMKAMLMSLASVVVQDDSGIPFHLLQKHYPKVVVFGKYRGLGDPELTGLTSHSGSAIKSLYQKDLAEFPSQPLVPTFNFGYRVVIGPTDKKQLPQQQPLAADGSKPKEHVELFMKRREFKGSHLILARNER